MHLLEDSIKALERQDRKAQQQLYKAYFSRWMALCVRYVGQHDDAMMVLNNGFLKIFTKIDKYTGDLPFEAWLKRVMINTCIDRYRARLNQTPTVELVEAGAETVLAETMINADAEYLLFLVRQLPPAYQATFNLFAVEGYEYQEIADLLGVSIGSVKSNLFKARLRLKELLTQRQTDNAYARQ